MVYGESCICLKGIPLWELEKITIVAFAEYRKPSSISYHRRWRCTHKQPSAGWGSDARSLSLTTKLTIHLSCFRAKPFSGSFPTRNSDQDWRGAALARLQRKHPKDQASSQIYSFATHAKVAISSDGTSCAVCNSFALSEVQMKKKLLMEILIIVYLQLPQLHIVGPCSYTGDGDGHYPTARVLITLNCPMPWR